MERSLVALHVRIRTKEKACETLTFNIRHGLSCTRGEGEEHDIDQLHFLLEFLELRFNSTSPPAHAGAVHATRGSFS